MTTKNEIYIITGKTVEEAMSAARAQYGAPDKDLSFQILEMPQKGFLGFGVKPAKIQVTVTPALEEVHLSDLVSELKSMKIGGEDEEPKREERRPDDNRKKNNQSRQERREHSEQRKENAPKGQNPPKQNAQKAQQNPQKQSIPQNAPKANAPKPQQNPPKAETKAAQPNPAKVTKPQPQPQPKPQPNPQPQPKPKSKVEEIKEEIQESVAEVKEEIREEIAEIKEEIAETVAEVKEEITEKVDDIKEELAEAKAERAEKKAAKAEPDDASLPAALRKPAHKNQAQKKNAPKKSAPARPVTDKSGEEKKQDLMATLMAMKSGEAKTAPSETPYVADHTGRPTKEVAAEKLQSRTDVIDSAVAEVTAEPEAIVESSIKEDPNHRSVADAVDAALAAFAAFEPAPYEAEAVQEEDRSIPVEFVAPEKLELALNFVNTLLANVRLDAKAVPATTGAEAPEAGLIEARVTIEGGDSGLLIGHHGETLDAIQTLMNLAANRRDADGKRDYVKIVLDMGDYRQKREDTLRQLARRTAARVVKNKRNVVLEPMNPYERRVIHSELHGVPNVSTHSVGSDENRKIVITYEGADKIVRPRRDRRDGEKGGEGRTPRGDRGNKTDKAEKSDAKPAENAGDKPAEKRDRRPRRRGGRRPEGDKPAEAQVQSPVNTAMADEGFETAESAADVMARQDDADSESLREY